MNISIDNSKEDDSLTKFFWQIAFLSKKSIIVIILF